MANNYKMDNRSRLLKTGLEAFDMLEEEEYGRKGRPAAPSKQKAPPATPVCRYPYKPQQAIVYQMMSPVSHSEEKITIYDAMKSHDGLSIMDSCDAMKLHDGLPIMDYPKRKSAAMAY